MLARRAPIARSPMRPSRRPATTAVERRHLDRIAALGCLVCGGAATVHHVTSNGFQRIARTHRRAAPLCPRHHMIQWGPKDSVEALGHAGFAVTHGVDLLAEADRLWRESQTLEARRG